jgi:glutathione S-transferase
VLLYDSPVSGNCYKVRLLLAHLGIVGDGMTLADIALYGYTHAAEEGGFELEPYPAVRAWLDRVAVQPGQVPIDA